MGEGGTPTDPEAEGKGAAPTPTGDALWDDWDLPPRRPTTMPVLHLAGFDGPMDLLLDLAERQKIAFGRMSILSLAEQFVAALERLASRVPLERRADWVVVAARLVLLRSRLVFAQTPEAAAEAEREAQATLRDIDAFAAVKRLASWLQARPQLGVDVFRRGKAERSPRGGGYVAIMEACLAVWPRGVAEEVRPPAVYQPGPTQLWSLSDAIMRLQELLAERPEGDELASFLLRVAGQTGEDKVRSKAAVAATFLAALELAKSGAASLVQAEAFGPIWLSGVGETSTRNAAA